MSNSSPASVSVPSEKTFSSFTDSQGANYAKHRPGYNPTIFKTVIDHHTSTGGQLNTILDVGCGPGTAVRALAPQFIHAIGLDPAEGMINSARNLGGTTSTDQPIRFEVSTAEDLGSHLSPPVEDSSVDLITASAAAHWFDMPRFWAAAARVLKPGGTVALWTVGDFKIHPSTPNAAAIQASMDEIEERELRPFFEPGNFLTRNLYKGLPLPWTLTPPLVEFDQASFFREEWEDEVSIAGSSKFGLDIMEKVLGTTSPVQRWRDANPDAVGTEKDVIKQFRAEIERLSYEAGVEKGKVVLGGITRSVLLMVKKKA